MQRKSMDRVSYGAIFLFSSWLVLGFTVLGDYGISYDETFQRNLGLANARYVREFLGIEEAADITDRRLLSPEQGNRYHGAVFTLLAYELERLTGADNFVARFRLRHRLSFLLYWLAGLALFGAARTLRLRNWWALLPPLLLLLYPRVFGHAFFNPKDIPLLAFYAFGVFTLLKLLERRTVTWALLHALSCGIAMAQRPAALILPVATAAVFGLEWIVTRRRGLLLESGKILAVYGVAFCVATTLFWPVLWSNPPAQFAEAWRTMRAFGWEGSMLFQEQWIKSTELPWYYLPVWIGISTPPLFLLGMLGSLIAVPAVLFRQSRRRSRRDRGAAESIDLGLPAVWLTAVGPLLAVIVLDPILYDGWRHFFFVAPPLLLLSAWGLYASYRALRKQRIGQRVLLLLLAAQLGVVAWRMINLHPHQQTYFNGLAGEQQFARYELDYWGPAFRQAWRQVGEKFPNDTLSVNGSDGIAHLNQMYLYDIDLRRRLNYVQKRTDADIYIHNHRDWQDWRPAFRNKEPPFNGTLIDSVMAGPNRLISIYRPASD